jgi:spore maturation protein CgeB
MRILLVCPSYYGYDIAIARALEALGHEVRRFGYFPHESLVDKVRNRIVDEVLPRLRLAGPRSRREAAFNRAVLEAARSWKPRLAVIVKGEILEPEIVAALARESVPVSWAFDDPYRYPAVVAALASYRAVASFSLDDTHRLVHDGYPAFYLPDGFDPLTFGASADIGPMGWRREVSLLGARYPERERLVARIVGRRTMGIWGGDWKRRPWRARYYQARTQLDSCCMGSAGPAEADIIYRSCAVNLNIHGSWDGLNMRVFEIPGAGGYQLCDERAGLSEMFEPGVEIETFSNEEEMLERIDSALGDADRRNRIAAAGKKRAHAEHTLAHRMSALISRAEES